MVKSFTIVYIILGIALLILSKYLPKLRGSGEDIFGPVEIVGFALLVMGVLQLIKLIKFNK